MTLFGPSSRTDRGLGSTAGRAKGQLARFSWCRWRHTHNICRSARRASSFRFPKRGRSRSSRSASRRLPQPLFKWLTRYRHLPRGAAILVIGASGTVGRLCSNLARHLGLEEIGGTCSPRTRPAVPRWRKFGRGGRSNYRDGDFVGGRLRPDQFRAQGGRPASDAAFDAIRWGAHLDVFASVREGGACLLATGRQAKWGDAGPYFLGARRRHCLQTRDGGALPGDRQLWALGTRKAHSDMGTGAAGWRCAIGGGGARFARLRSRARRSPL